MDLFKEMVQKYTIQVDRKIKKICAPLADYLSIPVFIFFRIEANGQFGHLSNYPENLDFFYSERLFQDYPYFVHPSLLRNGCAVTVLARKESDMETIKERFHMAHLFLMLEHSGNNMEGYGFATKSSQSDTEVDFFPKLGMMQIFVSYFKREIQPLIKHMMNDGYNLAMAKGGAFFKVDPLLPLVKTDTNMQRFLHLTSPLSPREHQCLELFKQGQSAQATASSLGLSQRTVEHYIDNIKEKLGCSSKWELLKW